MEPIREFNFSLPTSLGLRLYLVSLDKFQSGKYECITEEVDICSEIKDLVKYAEKTLRYNAIIQDENIEKKKHGQQEGLNNVCVIQNDNYEIDEFISALKIYATEGYYGEMQVEVKELSLLDISIAKLNKFGGILPQSTCTDGGIVVIRNFGAVLAKYQKDTALVLTNIMRNAIGKISTRWSIVVFCHSTDEINWWYYHKNLQFKDLVKFISIES